MPVLAPPPKFVALDGNGNPIPGARIYSFIAGTSTPLVTYADASLNTPNPNPVQCDAAGRCNLWLDGAYKLEFRDSNDVLIWTVDNVTSPASSEILTSSLAGLSASASQSSMRMVTDATRGIWRKTAFAWWAKLGGQVLNVWEHGVHPSQSGASNRTALQAAINTAATYRVPVYIPSSENGKYDIDGPLYLGWHTTLNPGWPDHGSNEGGTLRIYGDGRMSVTDRNQGLFRGTTINFTHTTDHGFVTVHSANPNLQHVQFQDMNVIHNASGFRVIQCVNVSEWRFYSVHVIQKHEDGHGVQLVSGDGTGGVYNNYAEDLWVVCPTEGNAGTRGLNIANVSGGSGGNNVLVHCTLDGFDIPLVLGREDLSGAQMREITLIGVQCRNSVTCCMFIGSTIQGANILGSHIEGTHGIGIWLKSECEAINISGCCVNHVADTNYGILIGDPAGVGDQELAHGVTVQNTRFNNIRTGQIGIMRHFDTNIHGAAFLCNGFLPEANGQGTGIDLAGSITANGVFCAGNYNAKGNGTLAALYANDSGVELEVRESQVRAGRLLNTKKHTSTLTVTSNAITIGDAAQMYDIESSGAVQLQRIILSEAGILTDSTSFKIRNANASDAITVAHLTGGGNIRTNSGSNYVLGAGDFVTVTRLGGSGTEPTFGIEF